MDFRLHVIELSRFGQDNIKFIIEFKFYLLVLFYNIFFFSILCAVDRCFSYIVDEKQQQIYKAVLAA